MYYNLKSNLTEQTLCITINTGTDSYTIADTNISTDKIRITATKTGLVAAKYQVFDNPSGAGNISASRKL